MGIKIDGTANRSTGSAHARPASDIAPVRGGSGAAFGSTLGQSMHQSHEELLEQLARDLVKQGEKLKERIDIGELKAYKRMVSTFLEEAVRDFGKFSRNSFLDRRGRHRVFATVNTVNEKLEALTRDVMSAERSNLDITAKIEDIRGMVLDLFL